MCRKLSHPVCPATGKCRQLEATRQPQLTTDHFLLPQQPALIKLASAQLLHRDASRGLPVGDGPLYRRGSPILGQERRVHVEGVERLEAREEGGGDELAEGGG